MNELVAGFSKTLQLKNGSDVTIRPAASGDADSLRDFFLGLPHADRLYLRHNFTDPEKFARWFAGIERDTLVSLLAVQDGKIIGHGRLERDPYNWSRHVASMRLIVAAPYRRQALGLLLAHELVEVARAKGYEKLIAQLMDTQTGAREICKAMGFVAEAQLKGMVKDLDGKRHDMLIMTCDLEDAWRHMEDLIEDAAPMGG